MKTVMKKMFSLLLVAVLLVGVMPFQAFADDGYTLTLVLRVNESNDETARRDYHVNAENANQPVNLQEIATYLFPGYTYKWSQYGEGNDSQTFSENTTVIVRMACNHSNGFNEETNQNATCTTAGSKTFTCKTEGCNYSYTETINALDHDWGDWVEIEAATCSAAGVEKRTCKRDANHTETRPIAIDSDAHNFSGGKCTICGMCKFCGRIGEHPENCKYYCNGTTNCPNDPTNKDYHNAGCLKTLCNKNGCTKDYGHTDECSVPCTKTAGCVLKQGHTGDCNTPCTFDGCTLGYNHSGDHSNACATCGKPKVPSPVHNTNCPYYYLNEAPSNTGNALVRVHVRLHNGTTLVDTVELLTYRDDKGTQIGDSVSAHKSLIVAELAEEYPEYSWSGNLYDDPGDSQDYNELIGTGTTVYINAYAGQDMVLVYVHNSRSHSSLRIIQLEGKRRGDTVTKKEVTSAVSKYYNVSSLSMYSEDAWEDYVDGENVESVSSLKIPEDDSYYVIDVKISGTAKSGSGSGYTADSSNPKTGDTIFAPVAVMGLSVSALAVLLYLNKKRAF